MISLAKEQTCLLELIKASLFKLKPEFPESVNWEKVFELAKVQCIVPLIASQVPEEYRNKWLEMTFQSKAHYMRVLYEQNSLTSLLKNNSIPFVIFKGTAAAIYYPLPSLRTYGDIDFYVPEDFFDLTRRLLEQSAFQCIENNNRHYEYERNGMVFELHSRISCDRYNDIEHFIKNCFSNLIEYKVGNCSFPGLPVYENGLVLLGHIMQHLKESGIGLRQILDWMLFVNRELDDSSWYNQFKPLATEAGLEKLAITVTYMCKKWLGLPKKISWCNDADNYVAEQLLIRLLDEGNFGSDRAPSESVKKSFYKEGTFKYLQRSGLINWPFAQKHAFFRPFAWFYQLCRYAGKGIAGLFTGKKVFMKNKHNMSLEELWERLE